jgi:hypothetical protein
MRLQIMCLQMIRIHIFRYVLFKTSSCPDSALFSDSSQNWGEVKGYPFRNSAFHESDSLNMVPESYHSNRIRHPGQVRPQCFPVKFR